MHPLGSGHTTIFELALLIDPILCGEGFDPKSFVRLFVCSFLHFFFIPNMPEVTTSSRGYKQARVEK